MSLPIVAAKPVKVMVGDKEYLVSPMTLGDWAEVEAWAQEQFYSNMKKRMELVGDGEVGKAIRARLATMTYAEVMRESSPYMDDGEGTAHRLHTMLRHNHPDIKLEEVKELMGFKEFNGAQLQLLGLTEEDEKKKKEEEKDRPTEES